MIICIVVAFIIAIAGMINGAFVHARQQGVASIYHQIYVNGIVTNALLWAILFIGLAITLKNNK